MLTPFTRPTSPASLAPARRALTENLLKQLHGTEAVETSLQSRRGCCRVDLRLVPILWLALGPFPLRNPPKFLLPPQSPIRSGIPRHSTSPASPPLNSVNSPPKCPLPLGQDKLRLVISAPSSRKVLHLTPSVRIHAGWTQRAAEGVVLDFTYPVRRKIFPWG